MKIKNSQLSVTPAAPLDGEQRASRARSRSSRPTEAERPDTARRPSPRLTHRHVMGAPDAVLRTIEACVLAVIDADPRLVGKRDRQRLRTIMLDLDASFSAFRVGEAFARVRELAQAGAVDARAFAPGVVWGPPSPDACDRAFTTLSRLFGRNQDTHPLLVERRRVAFFAQMGCTDRDDSASA